MMKNKIILFSLIILLSMIYVSAQSVQTLGVFQQGSCVNLIQICNTCTFNNISNVISPNSTVLLSSVLMQKSGTYYNYTFCNTTQLGRYIVNGFADNDVWSYDFIITSSGRELNTSDSLMSILIFCGILMIAIIFFFLAFVFRSGKSVWVSLFFMCMGILIVVVDFGFIMNIMNRYSENIGYVSPILNNLYLLITILLYIGGIAVVIGLLADSVTKFSKTRYGGK